MSTFVIMKALQQYVVSVSCEIEKILWKIMVNVLLVQIIVQVFVQVTSLKFL